MTLRVRMLGPFELDGSTAHIESRKGVELLCLLLLAPGQARSREAIATALWPDDAPEASRRHLRQTLWHVHRAVDDDHDLARLVVADNGRVTMNRDRGVWCDAVELTAAAARIARDPEDVGDRELDDVLALYRGPLLDGCYADWCLVERERLDGLYLGTLDAAAARAELRADHGRTELWAAALLRVDPAHECSHQRLMRAHAARGDRTRALRQFERCVDALESELGVLPSPDTLELAATLRAGTDAALATDPPTDPSAWGWVVRELAALRRSLDELRATLTGR